MPITVQGSRKHLPSALLDRDSLVPGTYIPDDETSGVIPGIARSVYSSGTVNSQGMREITTNGALYENLDFMEDVEIKGPNNVFINCMGRGGATHPSYNRGCFTLGGNANHNNTTFLDCSALPRFHSYYRDGWVGNNYTATRCKADECNDGFGAFSNPNGAGDCNVELLGIYVPLMMWWSQDPAHNDGTHNDGVQYQGGSHFVLRGAHIRAEVATAAGSLVQKGNDYAGAAVQINQNTHNGSDILIEKNYFDYGVTQISFNKGSDPTMSGLTVIDNKFKRNTRNTSTNGDPEYRNIIIVGATGGGWSISGVWVGTTAENTTNRTWDANNSLLTVGRASGIRVT